MHATCVSKPMTLTTSESAGRLTIDTTIMHVIQPTVIPQGSFVIQEALVEFYLYPTVSAALIHLIKPGLIRWD